MITVAAGVVRFAFVGSPTPSTVPFHTDADGLVHISQLRDERVETVADAVREGEYVWVVVTDIKEENKVSLSMRLVDQDTGELKEPLNDVDAATPSARRTGELPQLYSVHKGTVARIQNFGAFVRIDNYGDGLVHVSQLCAYRVEDPNDVVDVGQKVRRPLHAVDARMTGCPRAGVRQGGRT